MTNKLVSKEEIREAAILCMQRITSEDLFVCSNRGGNPIERMVYHIGEAITALQQELALKDRVIAGCRVVLENVEDYKGLIKDMLAIADAKQALAEIDELNKKENEDEDNGAAKS